MINHKEQFVGKSSQRIYFNLSLPSILVAFVIVLTIVLIFEFLPPKLPLFYSLPWGEGQLATHQQFYLIPASIILINLLNLMILWKLPPSYNFFKKILIFSTNITTVILTVTFIKIVLIFL